MKIAVEPDPSRWITVPKFPAPGWARKTAELSSALAGVSFSNVDSIAAILSSLASTHDAANCVRLVHIAPGEQYFIADIHLEAAMDDGSRSARLATQIAHIESLLPDGAATNVASFRPLPEAAGLVALRDQNKSTVTGEATQGVVVVRMGTSLPTRPVDTVMRLWGAPPDVIRENLDDIGALFTTISPLRA